MDRDQVRSPAMRSVGYDPDTQILEVEFIPKKNQEAGAIDHYVQFSPADWQDFRQLKSLGRHFSERIEDVFGYHRVAEPVEKAVEEVK